MNVTSAWEVDREGPLRSNGEPKYVIHLPTMTKYFNHTEDEIQKKLCLFASCCCFNCLRTFFVMKNHASILTRQYMSLEDVEDPRTVQKTTETCIKLLCSPFVCLINQCYALNGCCFGSKEEKLEMMRRISFLERNAYGETFSCFSPQEIEEV